MLTTNLNINIFRYCEKFTEEALMIKSSGYEKFHRNLLVHETTVKIE